MPMSRFHFGPLYGRYLRRRAVWALRQLDDGAMVAGASAASLPFRSLVREKAPVVRPGPLLFVGRLPFEGIDEGIKGEDASHDEEEFKH